MKFSDQKTTDLYINNSELETTPPTPPTLKNFINEFLQDYNII